MQRASHASAAALLGCHLRLLAWCSGALFPIKKSVCAPGIADIWTASLLLADPLTSRHKAPRHEASAILLVVAPPGQGPTGVGLRLIWRDSNRDRGPLYRVHAAQTSTGHAAQLWP